MEKTIIEVKGDKAEIKGNTNSLIAKILAQKGKVRINTPLVKKEVEIENKG